MKTLIKKPGKPKSLASIEKKKKVVKTEEKPQKVKKLKKVLEEVEAEVAEVEATKKSKKITKKDTKDAGKKKKTKKSHKEELEGLKDIDPEFYDFLKKNDKQLLEFNMLDSDDDEEDEEVAPKKDVKTKTNSKKEKKSKKSHADDSDDDFLDDDEEDDDEDMDDDDEEEDEKFHKPNAELEVASDESDFEGDDDAEADQSTDGVQKVTLNLLRQWQIQLEQDKIPIEVVRKVTQAFSSALASITPDADQVPLPFKVVGSAAFNGVIQLCVLHLQPAILRFLGVKEKSNIPLHKTKKWNKVRGCLRYYLTDLIRLVEQVSSPNILSVLLKHLHQMANMVAPFSTLGKTILKRLIVLWSTGDETIRVVAFLCILKITRNQQATMLNHVLKAMYLSYVRNSKFVSPNTLPSINFMRRSLVEMFALDLNTTYQHAFLYIRQLAIHLRNAVILKKKDSFQAVYNWQYINSLRLWCDLLGLTADKQQLQPLIYPLVTIAIGVIRLIPTAQYFPLRFHCLQSLIELAKNTHTFIPVLPLILEVLRSNTFNKKHSSVSMKPLQFTCILRLNKGQLAENGFRDEVVEQVCGLTLEYLAYESNSLAFCDLAVHTVTALKSYLKDCRNANYSRKIKQLIDKIAENSKFIEQERRKISFGLKDTDQIRAWETQVRNKGTPLDIYYNAWVKTHETKKRRQAAQADTVNDDYDLPVIKKPTKKPMSIKNENGEVELFPSDSEDDEGVAKLPGVGDSDDEMAEEKPKKKTKKDKATKKVKKPVAEQEVDIPVEEPDNEEVDIVKDLDMDDW
ncbi:nucleolar complex protein 2 homolog [Musca vetustissima]|uniref:nucleolar complex protein 2 homolog n=1 Tax=Musca vetustissima TaxID=27455 RepID=UPI002AB69F60|nr:nucleolar complex protein 2 homolog [Musca vetustissima]